MSNCRATFGIIHPHANQNQPTPKPGRSHSHRPIHDRCINPLFPSEPAGDAALGLGSLLLNLRIGSIYLLDSIGLEVFSVLLGFL